MAKRYNYTVYILSWVLLFLLQPLMLQAQKTSCTLRGTIAIKGGDKYPYRLELDMNGTSGKGISVTDQDGTAVRTRVNAVLKREHGAMVVTENAALGFIPDSMEVCYLSVVMRWKEKKGIVYFSGMFAGKKKNNELCYQGTVDLQAPASQCTFLQKPKDPSKDNAKPLTDTVTGAGFNKITDGAGKELKWKTPTCTLEMWDGGVIDGDALTVMHNGKPLVKDYLLGREPYRMTIPLLLGRNELVFVAGDEGSAPPNTAQVILYDGDTPHRFTAFNKKGKTASVILVR